MLYSICQTTMWRSLHYAERKSGKARKSPLLSPHLPTSTKSWSEQELDFCYWGSRLCVSIHQLHGYQLQVCVFKWSNKIHIRFHFSLIVECSQWLGLKLCFIHAITEVVKCHHLSRSNYGLMVKDSEEKSQQKCFCSSHKFSPHYLWKTSVSAAINYPQGTSLKSNTLQSENLKISHTHMGLVLHTDRRVQSGILHMWLRISPLAMITTAQLILPLQTDITQVPWGPSPQQFCCRTGIPPSLWVITAQTWLGSSWV